MSAFTDKLISKEEAGRLQKNWIGDQGRLIDHPRKEKDVRDFLFDLEELQEYINLVREQSAAQGISRPGIRIHFGAYGDEKKKRATIFLQATHDVKDVQQTEADLTGDEVPNNYEIMALNTVQGGFPPIDL